VAGMNSRKVLPWMSIFFVGAALATVRSGHGSIRWRQATTIGGY